MTKAHFREVGAAHVVLTGAILLLVIGALGIAGYNALSRHNVSSNTISVQDTLDQAKAKLDSGDVYSLTESEKEALDDEEIVVTKPPAPSINDPAVKTVPNPTTNPSGTPKTVVKEQPMSSASLKRLREFSTGSTDLPAYRDTVTANGSLWFTNANTPYIANMTTSGKVTKYKSQVQGAYFTSIAKGSDGRLWFAGNTQKIHAMTSDGKETVYPIPSNPTLVESMTLGPDKNIWFTTWNTNQQGIVGKITPAGKVTEYSLGGYGYARGLTVGSDGRIWFATREGVGAVSASGKIQYISAYEGRSYTPWSIARGSKGYIWLLGHDGSSGSRLMRVSVNGKVSDYTSETTKNIFRLFSGPDETVWFSEWTSGRIGRIDATGKITKFAAPNNLRNAYGITFIGRSAWVSYATPLKSGATESAGTLVEFKF